MEPTRLRRVILGLVLVAVAFYLGACLLSFDPREGPFPDYPPNKTPAGVCGLAGAYVSSYALAFLGWTSLGVTALIAVAGVCLVGGIRPAGAWSKVVAALLGLLALTIALGLPYAGTPELGERGWTLSGLSSGVLGMLLVRSLYGLVGWAGIIALLAVLASVSIAVLGAVPLAWLVGAVAGLCRRTCRRGARVPRRAAASPLEKALHTPPPAQEEQEPEPWRQEPPAADLQPAEATDETEEEEPPEGKSPEEALEAELQIVTRAAPREHPRPVSAPRRRAAPALKEDEIPLPPLHLLDSLGQQAPGNDEKEIRQKGQVLERTLRDFNIEARVVRVQRGPVITMYEMALAAGTKVSRVESLAADLAIALKAPNVRTVAPIPGRNTIGIEVPNTQREIVTLRELLEGADSRTAGMSIPLFLGKDTAGNPLIVDLAMAPHLLLAGATGSGKSVAINSIICSILMTRTPREVQMLLVDPKSVEFSDYTRLPHLICPILTDMKKAAAVIQWACKKMDERYSILARVGVRDIAAYNHLGDKEIIRRLDPEEDAEIDDVPFYMPHIVIVVDELGELMLVAAKEVEGSVIRLSQKARAVGIHLICATQRPSVDVITGLIKANLPARVAFHVSSKVDSRTILDRNGAELLLGRGDMLMLPPGSSRLVRAQGTYLSPAETLRIVGFLTAQGEPQFRSELREYSAAAVSDAQNDELYEEAVRIVLETQRGSVSLLQRRLSIGYSRAARLVDMMAEAGIVGAYKGSKAREVMLTLDEWEAARGNAE